MDKRLIYSVVLKVLFLLAFLVLLIVLVKSLFTASDETNKHREKDVTLVSLDLKGLIKGDVRKARWKGKDIGVLNRKGNRILYHTKYLAKIPHESVNSGLRSLRKEYFVYYNHGDSGNCPLFKEADGFKDTCSGTRFDTSGREIGKGLQGARLEIPPHYFQGDKLFIGVWREE
ncbi:MAG: hypothetical protein L3J51_00095 [Cocleimonas sp.]|nr:hypothetical protein [Cocleimonas sp.]